MYSNTSSSLVLSVHFCMLVLIYHSPTHPSIVFCYVLLGLVSAPHSNSVADQNITLSYPPMVHHNPTHPIVCWYVLFSLASALHPNSIPTHSDLSWTHLHKHDSQHAHLPPMGG